MGTMKQHSDYKQFIGKGTKASAEASPLPPTPPDIEGPFYQPDAPFKDNGVLDTSEYPDKPLTLIGRVVDTNGDSIPGAVLDVWQADGQGNYDEFGPKFRGKFHVGETEATYDYLIQTIVPGDYKISEPGEPDDFRCAHIHFKVSAPGYKTLTTQLYFKDDPYNATDHWFDPRRVIKQVGVEDESGTIRGFFEFVLERS